MEEADEPGAEDNLLHLDPTDDRWKDTVGEWEDGKKYTLTNVEVEQISPGELRVLSLEASDAAPEEEETEPETPSKKPRYSNPAVAGLMG